jgi:hypothetical protein
MILALKNKKIPQKCPNFTFKANLLQLKIIKFYPEPIFDFCLYDNHYADVE